MKFDQFPKPSKNSLEKSAFNIEKIPEETIKEIKDYYQKIGNGFLSIYEAQKEQLESTEKLFNLLDKMTDGKFLDHAHPNHVWGSASQQAGKNVEFSLEAKLRFHNDIPTFFGGNPWVTKNPESILVIMGPKNKKFKKILEQSHFYPKQVYLNDEYNEYKFKTPKGKDAVVGTTIPGELIAYCILNEIPIYTQYKDKHEYNNLSETYGDEIYLDEITIESSADRLNIPFTWGSLADTVVDLKNGKIYKYKN
ncbi:MAG: hypothetical protein WC089_01975 [Candidatus Paceibacterota bacterium]